MSRAGRSRGGEKETVEDGRDRDGKGMGRGSHLGRRVDDVVNDGDVVIEGDVA